MEEVKLLINTAISNGHDVWVNGGSSSESISLLEHAMGLTFPMSLRNFLVSYGGLGIYDNFISGIVSEDSLELSGGGIYADTMFLREDFPDLPKSYWVIQVHEDGAYCIDTASKSRGDEFHIVNFEYGQSQIVSDSFSAFLEDKFFAPWI
ncbi:SMI1/KNR4 family protein [Vibrio mimicus]|uniref:SMI1/KNR4 family protein n=1 Tax=Vibrio mimicus TaxID=674 RepID=UPI002FF321DA